MKGKDCIKKFCESLREHAMEIIGENGKNGEKTRASEITLKFKNLSYL